MYDGRDRSFRLVHPEVPGDGPGLLIAQWVAGELEGELDLTVMVALMPDHVLEHKDRVVVVKVHVQACLQPAFYGVAHRMCAAVQHLSEAATVALGAPLSPWNVFFRVVGGELGSVLKDEHKPHIVDVHEHLRDGGAAFRGSGVQAVLRNGAEQVDQDGVVARSREERLAGVGLMRQAYGILFVWSRDGKEVKTRTLKTEGCGTPSLFAHHPILIDTRIVMDSYAGKGSHWSREEGDG